MLSSPRQSCQQALNQILSSTRCLHDGFVSRENLETGESQAKNTPRRYSFIQIQEPTSEPDLPSTKRAASSNAGGCQKHVRLHSPPPSKVDLFGSVFDEDKDMDYSTNFGFHIQNDRKRVVPDEKLSNMMLCSNAQSPTFSSSLSDSVNPSLSDVTFPISFPPSGTTVPSFTEIQSIPNFAPHNPPFSPRNLRVGLSVSPFPSDFVPSVSTAEYIDQTDPHSESVLTKHLETYKTALTLENKNHSSTYETKLQNELLEEQRWRSKVGTVNEWYRYPPIQMSAEFLPARLKHFDWGPAPTPDRYEDNVHWECHGL